MVNSFCSNSPWCSFTGVPLVFCSKQKIVQIFAAFDLFAEWDLVKVLFFKGILGSIVVETVAF